MAKLAPAIMALAVLVGCARFHPEPISPSKAASSFEARTLEDPGLKQFIENNIHQEISPWPVQTWNLNTLTLAAFYYNPDMEVARAKWKVAEAGKKTAGSRPNPTISVGPEFSMNPPAAESPWILAFSFDIPIETAGKRRFRIATASHLSDAARYDIAGVAWGVRSRLRKNLLDLYRATKAVELLEKRQANQKDIVDLLEKRRARGEISLPEVTQARIAFNRITLELQEIEKQKAEAYANLSETLGVPESVVAKQAIDLNFFDSPPASNMDIGDARRQALTNRPDILSELSAYEATQSALRLEIAKQYPDVHIGPGYSFDQGQNKWALGFSIELPVLNRNQGPIAEAEARRTQAAAEFNALQAGIIGDVDSALASYEAAVKKLETATELLTEQEKRIRSVEALVKAGEEDQLALLEARLEYYSNELDRLDALVAAQRALGKLEDALQRPINPATAFP